MNQLEKILEESAVNESTALVLKNSFQNFMDQVASVKEKAYSIKITDPSQKEEMKLARELRISIRDARTSADKVRESLKRDATNYNRAVQSVYNMIHSETTEMEKHLREQEDYIELQAQKAKIELRDKRSKLLVGLIPDEPNYLLIDAMSDDEFEAYRSGLILIIKQKAEAERIAEEERVLAEKQKEEERARVQAENDRLKAEMEAKQKAHQKELEETEKKRKEDLAKAEAEAEIKKKALEEEVARGLAEKKRLEAEKREAEIKAEAARKADQERMRKLEQEAKAKVEAEEKAKKDRLEQERKARSAPDKEKFKKLSADIAKLEMPDLQGERAKKILEDVKGLLFKVRGYISEKAETL